MRIISYILLSLVALSKASIEFHKVKPQFVTHLIPSIGSRVVGGTPAQPNGIPYQAHLSNGPGSFCGASIIRDDAVLTAAHCVSFGDYFDVTIGDHNLDKNDGTEQIIRSRAIVIHEKWDPSMTANDIAILFLSKKIKLDSTAKIIRLNTNKDIVNKEATVSGWGRFSDDSGYQSNVLLYGTDYLISNKECDRYFGWYVTENTVCLNGKRGIGSCYGDSGGPLVIRENGETVLAGIVSFASSIGCEKGYPSAYTRVSNYLNWIDEKLYQN